MQHAEALLFAHFDKLGFVTELVDVINLSGRKRAGDEADGPGFEQMADDREQLFRSFEVLDEKIADQTVGNALRHMREVQGVSLGVSCTIGHAGGACDATGNLNGGRADVETLELCLRKPGKGPGAPPSMSGGDFDNLRRCG